MSNEREKEKENNNEVESIDHICHHHPLALTEAGERDRLCIGCRRDIRLGETIYACRQGCPDSTLHVRCAEMPQEIRLSIHPQHTLILRKLFYFVQCAVCRSNIDLGYSCASADECEFQVHVGCVQDMEVLPSCIDHASHPRHQLTLLWRPRNSCSSMCDACGTIEKGNFYMCMVCQYWVHDSCASLSAVAHFKHHHHPLSLIYHLPIEYIKYNFTCDICFKDLVPRYWAYHCETCRYVVHVKCAIKTTTINVEADAAEEEEEVITFPVNNAVEELIGSFVAKAGGVIANPNEIVNRKYKFHNHELQLRLIEEEEDESSDEDDFNYRDSKLVCDGCILPIFPKQQESSDKYCKYYMSCGECKYFLHWACFNLPYEIPSHPLHPFPNHNLTLQTCPKLDYSYCRICKIRTNGLFYECTKCGFKIDVKCVSLPNTIKHKAHPHHYLKLYTWETARNISLSSCYACGYIPYGTAVYICDVCIVIFHASCVLLPAVITNRGWDKHPLPLTFDASVEHPSSFCCDICEKEMNPKLWMYHCRTCDFSAHPYCFPTASGLYRNTKFGQRYVVASVHDHPIAYQLLTKKLYCDVCGQRNIYGTPGFQCVSDKCEFSMCFYICSINHQAEMKVVIEEASSSDH